MDNDKTIYIVWCNGGYGEPKVFISAGEALDYLSEDPDDLRAMKYTITTKETEE